MWNDPMIISVSEQQPTVPSVMPTNPVTTTRAPNIVSQVFRLRFIDAGTRYDDYYNNPNSAAYRRAVVRYTNNVRTLPSNGKRT